MFKISRTKEEQPKPAAPAFTLPLLPLRDIVVFPSMVVPLFVGRDKSVNAIEQAMNTDKKILLSAQKNAKTDDPRESDIHRVGTAANILQLLRLPDGTVSSRSIWLFCSAVIPCPRSRQRRSSTRRRTRASKRWRSAPE